MLIRALLISALLHLVILLSASRLDAFVPPANSGLGVKVLEMRIGSRDKREQLSSHVSKQGAPDAKPEAAVRKSNLPSDQKAKHFNIGRFFRSTVEIANSGNAASDRVLDPRPTDSPPVSAEALGQYRLNVARSARQFKVYPSLARENGWEGVVQVSVTMPIGFGNPTVSLGRSSGYGVLDRQAIEMVEQAVSLAVMPEGLRGRSMSISLPVEYRLAD
jgi:TonB family protein